jgi:hypothetical protein
MEIVLMRTAFSIVTITYSCVLVYFVNRVCEWASSAGDEFNLARTKYIIGDIDDIKLSSLNKKDKFCSSIIFAEQK